MDAFVSMLSQFFRLFRWYAVIRPWELGLRVRFGKHKRILSPGMHPCIPLIDEIFVQSIRMRVSNCPVQTIQTADGKFLTVGVNLGYAIDNVEVLYETLHDAEDTLINLTLQAVATEVSRRPANELTPENLGAEASRRIRFDRFGIRRATIRVTDFVFARTYRLLNDKNTDKYGSALETNWKVQ